MLKIKKNFGVLKTENVFLHNLRDFTSFEKKKISKFEADLIFEARSQVQKLWAQINLE